MGNQPFLIPEIQNKDYNFVEVMHKLFKVKQLQT